MLQIVNLSKKYTWHRAPRDTADDDPELPDEDEPVEDIEPGTERWALRGINVTINPGERVGIIGTNGSGKSTLVNILAGITLPSGGYVRGKGFRVLLNSLRSPFRGQLTGRQNLHILTSLLGVDVKLLEERLPAILAFSDMEDFIDRRVLHYSTQQYRRLSFATGLMLDPDIILSDDTLGIGDARYQQRTEQLIAEKVDKEGVIFIFASNRLSTVQEMCTRVIWLEEGVVASDGPADEVIEAFMDADKGTDEPDKSDDGEDDNRPVFRGDSSLDTTVEPFPAELRQPVDKWADMAQSATERRLVEHRKRLARWTRDGRQWLTAEKSFACAPGLGELVSVRLDLSESISVASEKSRLEIVVYLEEPGTEVAVFVDGVVNKTHVYSSEMPGPLVVPSRGLYFFTVSIENALLQPRNFGQPYTKSKFRVKVYLRAPDSENWKLVSGIVRVQLQGTEWQPRIPYPENRGPVLKPLLEWNVERAVDEFDASDGPQPGPARVEDRAALVASGARVPLLTK